MQLNGTSQAKCAADTLTLGESLVEREGGVEPVRRQARPEGAVHFPALVIGAVLGGRAGLGGSERVFHAQEKASRSVVPWAIVMLIGSLGLILPILWHLCFRTLAGLLEPARWPSSTSVQTITSYPTSANSTGGNISKEKKMVAAKPVPVIQPACPQHATVYPNKRG